MDETEATDHRMRAHEQLTALRETLSKFPIHADLRTHYVDEFHTALDHLRDAGEIVEEYQIPNDWIDRHEPSRDSRAQAIRSRNPTPQQELTIECHYLQTRVNAVLGYFTLKAAVQDQASSVRETLRELIGFETSN
jgi:hypothetical protein